MSSATSSSCPFLTDQTAAKKRPAIVVSTRRYNNMRPDVILIGVTNRFRGEFGEIAIQDWAEAGLLRPSTIKLSWPPSNKT